jgi:hypothetical protein
LRTAGCDDLAVDLNSHCECLAVAREGCCHLAPDAEARIETAVGVEAGKGELTTESLRGGASGGDDLTVRLDGNGESLIKQTNIGRHFAPSAETRIEAAVGVVAGKGEVEGAGATDHDELAVRLDRNGSCAVGNGAEVGCHLAAGAEAQVEIAWCCLSRNDEKTDC